MAVLLIVSCVRIYHSGDRPFNREVVAVYASKLAVMGYLCLLSVLAGLLLSRKEQTTKAVRDERALLLRYHSELPTAERERKLRRIYRLITTVLVIALFVWPILYYCDASHFSVTDLNADIIRAVLVALIPAAVSLSLVYLCGQLVRKSISREIKICKDNGEKPGKIPAKRNMSEKVLLGIRSIVLAVAVVFIILGIANGGAEGVLGKAIRICTECIGLG